MRPLAGSLAGGVHAEAYGPGRRSHQERAWAPRRRLPRGAPRVAARRPPSAASSSAPAPDPSAAQRADADGTGRRSPQGGIQASHSPRVPSGPVQGPKPDGTRRRTQRAKRPEPLGFLQQVARIARHLEPNCNGPSPLLLSAKTGGSVLCVGGRVPGDCSTLRVARVGNLPTGSTANTQAACEDQRSSKTTHLARKETPRGRAGTGIPTACGHWRARSDATARVRAMSYPSLRSCRKKEPVAFEN